MRAPFSARFGLCVVVPFLCAGLTLAAWQDGFPAPKNSEKNPGEPMPAQEAARRFSVPEGLRVNVFAAEPVIRNPIACAYDSSGQLWVAENYTYAEREIRFDPNQRDRVVILRDNDGDGVAEQSRVFLDNLQRLTSVEVGLGGVWLMCPPRLLFVPDRNNDNQPDGPPEVMLEGFDVPMDSHHNFANGLRWGPDGWLYGRSGASAFARVRRPDQIASDAIPLAGGIWRYHPLRKVFEPLCHGTTNPWGHDWDARGECFFVNTVNGHLWHMIPGGHCRRPHTVSPNPLVYEPLEMAADHWHFDTGRGWTSSRDAGGGSDGLGGGHAHSGALIYQGTMWPRLLQGRLLTLNFHGRRVNVENLVRQGSGFIARHEPDILRAADPFFRGIDLVEGPDGAVLILDWSDTGECHDSTGVHRTSGRVYRVASGSGKFQPLAAGQLVGAALGQEGEWHSRMARRQLATQAQQGKPPGLPPDALAEGDPSRQLRALWLLNATGQATTTRLLPLLRDPDESVRVWAVRLLLDSFPLDTVEGKARTTGMTLPDGVLEALVRVARQDASALVRLSLASALGRLPVRDRPALATALLGRATDAQDANLAKMIWYGLIPVALEHAAALPALAAASQLPQVRVWIARRLAERATSEPAPLQDLLAITAHAPEGLRREVLQGVVSGLAGIRKVAPPAAWNRFDKQFTGADAPSWIARVRQVEVVFGSGRALNELRDLARDNKAEMNARRDALRALIEAGPEDLRQVCEKLLAVRSLNVVALEGLTRFDDPGLGTRITAQWSAFYPIDRPEVVRALAARPSLAGALLDAIAAGRIPADTLTASLARQIRSFNSPALETRLAAVWGTFRDSPTDKQELMHRLKASLAPGELAKADTVAGRAIFARACGTCHRLYGVGSEIGPDLTGAGRKDLDYLLGNLVDPSAVLAKDYQMSVLEMKDGRLLTGVVVAQTDAALTVQTDRERRIIPRTDVESRRQTTQSLMPDGLLAQMKPAEIRDLIAYLMTDRQVAERAPPGP